MARMWGVILDRGGVQKARSAGCPGQPDGPCGAQLGNPPDWVTFAGVPLNWLPIGDFYSRLGVGTKVLDRGLSTFVGSPLLRPAAEWGRTGGCVPGVAPWGPFRSLDLEGRAWAHHATVLVPRRLGTLVQQSGTPIAVVTIT